MSVWIGGLGVKFDKLNGLKKLEVKSREGFNGMPESP
ncbi:hypothetical protein TcasGA2_TC034971 [Tribolium castaneum]|uniref:Uncharacterized protein n=1 Tax=Tribolium castaneum TaxID=7070 RepID=A0A139W9J9_TRICA|nr:hypothetical protein TcasGA2_TC034971 [Tribolium castaneum]